MRSRALLGGLSAVAMVMVMTAAPAAVQEAGPCMDCESISGVEDTNPEPPPLG